MKYLKVLGTGCPSCEKLAEMVTAAANDLGLEYELEKVSEIEDIIAFGVSSTPALVVDGELKVAGGLPSPESLRAMLS